MITYDHARKMYPPENTPVPDIRRTILLSGAVTGQEIKDALGIAVKVQSSLTKDFGIEGLFVGVHLLSKEYVLREQIIADIDGSIIYKIGVDYKIPYYQTWPDPRRCTGIIIREGDLLDNVGITLDGHYEQLGVGSTCWGKSVEENEKAQESKNALVGNGEKIIPEDRYEELTQNLEMTKDILAEIFEMMDRKKKGKITFTFAEEKRYRPIIPLDEAPAKP